jgi:outer membrane murein-binding lipoprotein Lpp
MKRITLVALLCWAMGSLAHAELYRWVDEQGTMNFTEEYGSIPNKYRSSVQTSDETVTTEWLKTPEPVAGEGGNPKGEPPAIKKPDVSSPALFAGKRGEVWRDELRQARAELKAYQDHLAMKRKMLADTTGMGRREYLGLTADVKDLEMKVNDLSSRLDTLNNAADKAGVPNSFR